VEVCVLEPLWQENNSIQSNPAFDFLKEPSENIYLLTYEEHHPAFKIKNTE